MLLFNPQRNIFSKDKCKYEFHYSKLSFTSKDFAYKILGKALVTDGRFNKNKTIGSYLHIHIGGGILLASSFLENEDLYLHFKARHHWHFNLSHPLSCLKLYFRNFLIIEYYLNNSLISA